MSTEHPPGHDVIGQPGRVPDVDDIIEALARASVGHDVRLAVDPTRQEPLATIAAAINLLLEDLAFRQREREEALHRVAIAEAKREFLAYLSHDMQTPLALLLGAVELLGPEATTEEVGRTLPVMKQAVGTLQRLVQQFLDLARLDADRPLDLRAGPMELRPVLDRAVGLFADRGLVDVVAPLDLPIVHGDPGRAEQIVVNLLSNAYKYAADPVVTVSIKDDGRAVEVTISDRGEGLSDADLQLVFGQFDRAPASNRAAGTGLGLFISRALAEAMGGSLMGRSSRGVGSRFTLRLVTEQAFAAGAGPVVSS